MNRKKRTKSQNKYQLFKTAGRLFLYAVFLFVAAYLGVTFWNARKRHQNLRSRHETYKQRVETLKQKNRVLAEKKRRLKQNPEAVERILREEYMMLEPDEYRIVD